MSQKTRAKFKCVSVKEHEGGFKEANLHAVYDQNGENNSFAEATPNGDLNIGISPGIPANDFFKPGKSYYLDFSEAPEE